MRQSESAQVAEAARILPFTFTLTARAENHLHGRLDLDDTIQRLQAYQEAGANVLYAPGVDHQKISGHLRLTPKNTETPFASPSSRVQCSRTTICSNADRDIATCPDCDNCAYFGDGISGEATPFFQELAARFIVAHELTARVEAEPDEDQVSATSEIRRAESTGMSWTHSISFPHRHPQMSGNGFAQYTKRGAILKSLPEHVAEVFYFE